MRNLISSLCLCGLVALLVGCQGGVPCRECANHRVLGHAAKSNSGCPLGVCGKGGCVHKHHRQAEPPAGPPTPTYYYPYYTLRGPRDFLQNNPPSIGP